MAPHQRRSAFAPSLAQNISARQRHRKTAATFSAAQSSLYLYRAASLHYALASPHLRSQPSQSHIITPDALHSPSTRQAQPLPVPLAPRKKTFPAGLPADTHTRRARETLQDLRKTFQREQHIRESSSYSR